MEEVLVLLYPAFELAIFVPEGIECFLLGRCKLLLSKRHEMCCIFLPTTTG